MALTLVTGRVGGGKSYYAVETCLQALKEGAVVHTNLDLKWDIIRGMFPPITHRTDKDGNRVELETPIDPLVKLPSDPAKWITSRKAQPGDSEDAPLIECELIVGGQEGAENLVVIDEASFEFGAENQHSKEHKDKLFPVRQLVTLQRHVGIDIIFVTQSKKKIDAKLREDASERLHCIKALTLPFIGWLAAPLRGDFRRDFYDQSDHYVTCTWHRFTPEVGKLYDTHGRRASVAMRLDPTRTAKAGETGKKGAFKMLASLALALVAISYGLYSTFRTITGDPASSEISAPDQAKGTKEQPVSIASSADAPQSVPASHRSGLREIVWDVVDEWVLAARWVKNGVEHVSTTAGQRFAVGLDYMGERILEVTQHRGWRYYVTESARVVVVRPMHPVEHQAAWQRQRLEVLGSKEVDIEIDPLGKLAEGAKGGLGL
jgi:zona occludens toxin (predicted ATPase)